MARFFVDTIALDGPDRLPSRFVLRWYGEDPDGYVVGYELRRDGGGWGFTTAQESTFTVTFAPGEQYKDILFELRAVDSQGARTDPPARLVVPLRNSPPVCTIDASVAPPDTTLPALTLSLQISDPDGAETVESLYVRINAGLWIGLSPRHTVLTFVPQNPSAASPTLVYSGTALTPLVTLPTALSLEDTNRIYVRVKDQGGLFSAVDSTRAIYVRRKTGDWLVLDSWTDGSAYAALQPDMGAAWGGGHDYWNLRRPTQRPPLRLPTWLHIWRLYPRVYWLGTSTALSELEGAEALIERYLLGGGRLFVNFPLSASLPASSPIFRWSPVDSIPSSPQNGLLGPGAQVASQVPSWPDLSNGQPFFLSGINPVYPKGTAQPLYLLPTLLQGNGQPWPASSTQVAATAFPGGAPGKYTQVFFILPLHQLGGDRVAFLIALQNAFLP